MKKNYFLCLVIACCATTLSAQLSLTQSAFENIAGDIETSQPYDSVNVLTRTTGQNQTWNFSAISQGTYATYASTYVAASSLPSASLFPGATLAEVHATNNYDFYKSSTGLFEHVGYYDIGAIANYTNAAIFSAWPISFGTNTNDTYSGELTGTALGTRTGTTTIKGAGTGTVIMPGNVQFTNVLQVVSTLIDVQQSNAGDLTIQLTQYDYFRAGQKSALITIVDAVVTSTANTGKITTVRTHTTTNTTVGINTPAKNNSTAVSVFPNPAKSQITIRIANSENDPCTVQIFNMLGDVVKTQVLGSTSSINAQISIAEFSPGIYFVKTQTGRESSLKKLVVE